MKNGWLEESWRKTVASVLRAACRGDSGNIAASRSGGWRRVLGVAAAVLGYVLSPLFWWNDMLVNVPIAFGGGLLMSRLTPVPFAHGFIFTYIVTNIAGLLMLHWGVRTVLYGERLKLDRKTLLSCVVTTALYTLAIGLLCQAGWIKAWK